MIGVCIIFWWIEMSIIILVIEMPCIILPLKQLWLHFVLGCFVGVGHGEKVFYDRQALKWGLLLYQRPNLLKLLR